MGKNIDKIAKMYLGYQINGEFFKLWTRVEIYEFQNLITLEPKKWITISEKLKCLAGCQTKENFKSNGNVKLCTKVF